jgi:hypothetical protein
MLLRYFRSWYVAIFCEKGTLQTPKVVLSQPIKNICYSLFCKKYALVKPFLSKKVKDVIQLSAKLEQVQEVYSKEALPAVMGGTQQQSDMEQAMLQALKTRYANMASFKLPPKPSVTPVTPVSDDDDDKEDDDKKSGT